MSIDLNKPPSWPASFPSPVRAGTRVLTYVFKSNTNVQNLVNYVKTFPNALVNVYTDKDGYTNVTITQATGATADAYCCSAYCAVKICF